MCVVRSGGEVPTLEASPSSLVVVVFFFSSSSSSSSPASSFPSFFLIAFFLFFSPSLLASLTSTLSGLSLHFAARTTRGPPSSFVSCLPFFPPRTLCRPLGLACARERERVIIHRRSARIYFRRPRRVLLRLLAEDMLPSLALPLARLITGSSSTVLLPLVSLGSFVRSGALGIAAYLWPRAPDDQLLDR